MCNFIRMLVGALLLSPGAAAAQEDLVIGGIFDVSGITAEAGWPFAVGLRDCFQYVNDSGGIGGRRVRLRAVDSGYEVDEAMSAYTRLVRGQGVVLVIGWGTAATEALKDAAARDQVPFVSGSFAASVSDPRRAPYNFFVAPTYSDQLRAWLAWVKTDWNDRSRAPRVAALYADNAYGRSPIAAGRAYAKELGLAWVYEAALPGRFGDAAEELRGLQEARADYAFINATSKGAATVLKQARRLGLQTRFGVNAYGFGEALVSLARGDAEGVTGLMPHAPYGAPVPGMQPIMAFNARRFGWAPRETGYVRGWATGQVVAEALRRAHRRGELTGAGIKRAFESLRDYPVGGLTSPVSYTSTDHRPSTATPVYVVKRGKLEKIWEYVMPRKPEWLGL